MSSWEREQRKLKALGRNRRVAGMLAAGMMALTTDANAAAYDTAAPEAERAAAIERLHNAGVRDLRRHGVQMRGLKHYRPINLDGATLPQDMRDTRLHLKGNNINADTVNVTNADWVLSTPHMSMQSAGGYNTRLSGQANNLNITGFWGYGLHADIQAPALQAENVMVYGGQLKLHAPGANISGTLDHTSTWGSDFSYGKFDVTGQKGDFGYSNFRGTQITVADEEQSSFTQSNVAGARVNDMAGANILATGADGVGDIAEIAGEQIDNKLNYDQRAAQARQKVASRWAYQLTYRM